MANQTASDSSSDSRADERRNSFLVRVIYCAVAVVSLFLWTIIAPVFWIPFLLRMIILFMVAALHDTFIDGGGTIGHAERGLGVAVNFYINGFTTIIEAIRRRGSMVGTSEQSHRPLGAGWR